MSQSQGTFIAFEGGEGAGKGTQIDLLKDSLATDAVITKEPGGTPVADEIRDILLSAENEIAARAELALFCASRGDHVEKVIAPALQEGKVVVCDRFDLSTVAYQIYGRQQRDHADYLFNFSEYMVGDYTPDIYIYLDVSVKEGLRRASDRQGEDSRLDQEAIEFHERVLAGYRQLAEKRDNCFRIDAEQSIEQVAEEVENIIVAETSLEIS